MNPGWDDLVRCLDGLENPAGFWLRDDDAISDTVPLRRLGDWARSNRTELLLAVVPAAVDATLSSALRQMPQLRPCPHGWAHKNHAPANQKKQELGAHRPVEIICEDIRKGAEALVELNALPILVPPWNRISAQVTMRLPEIGLKGLSVFANAFCDPASSGRTERDLTVRNCHLDIIDWHGTRGGRQHQTLIDELIRHVLARAPRGEPIGILTHHLIHDETAWSFLETLGDIIRKHPQATWLTPEQVFNFHLCKTAS